MMRFIIGFFVVLLAACESNPPAPVIERAPQTSKPKPPETKPVDSKTATAKDWRPDSHIVKKGDTLFGIGLEYGIDYKEIAAANNIVAPYPINIGQKLDLSSFKTKPAAVTEANKSTEDGVVLTPIKIEPVVVGDKPVASDKPIVSVVTPVLSEPKAMREPYSKETFNRTQPAVVATTKPADVKPAETKPSETKPTDAKPGKVAAGFNEATNKGIDIAGKTGQAINAASGGKVIYSGSDLRGYGKLVIVKHNKTYLSVYAHNSKIVVKEGQTVSAGQKIAEMGNTDSNTVKLHFEIRRLGKSVDPARYLNQ
jgi:lipoprotein NlpD